MPSWTDLQQREEAPGLDPQRAAELLDELGPNELPPPPRETWLRQLARLVAEPMSLLLIGAAMVSGLSLDEWLDAAAILAIVVLNTAIAAAQERRSADALAALQRLESPTATIRRGGRILQVQASELVPGDLVLLTAGDRMPADIELTWAAGVEIDESVLTGESLPVARDAGQPAHAGTLITRGQAAGTVTATGARTQLGRIAGHLAAPETATPLQRGLAALTARLGGIAVGVAALALTLAIVRADQPDVPGTFLSAVALAVAAVPEGLATVTTVALAMGVRRMATHGAIVRRLAAVETLGSTTVIATDKTGTLTQNRMRLTTVLLPSGEVCSFDALTPPARAAMAEVAIGCNDASMTPPVGDPLEVALLAAFTPAELAAVRDRLPRVAEIPFDAARQRMSTLHRSPAGLRLLVKGAPEAVLPRCATARIGDRRVPLTGVVRTRLSERAAALAASGARVLALAAHTLPAQPHDLAEAEQDLTLVGFVGLRDPVRAEAAASVAAVRAAGVDLLMVTGDHLGTARAVASEVGLAPCSETSTGEALGGHSRPTAVPVYARMTPDDKLELIDALHADGQVVAMTGDGVNDAPALHRADIGVALGATGSDVAREAADLVITDDNLATIVTAIREGRGIYDNIRKVVDYLVAGNFSEVATVVIALLLLPDFAPPLLPLQLLWVNLLTDGLPAIALGLDRIDPGVMLRSPRDPAEKLLSGRRVRLLLGRGAVMAAAALAVFALSRYRWQDGFETARTLLFTALVVAHLLYAFVARCSDPLARPASVEDRPSSGRANRLLIVAVAGGIALQVVGVTFAPLQRVLGTVALDGTRWLSVAAIAVLPTLLMLLVRSALPTTTARTEDGRGPAQPSGS